MFTHMAPQRDSLELALPDANGAFEPVPLLYDMSPLRFPTVPEVCVDREGNIIDRPEGILLAGQLEFSTALADDDPFLLRMRAATGMKVALYFRCPAMGIGVKTWGVLQSFPRVRKFPEHDIPRSLFRIIVTHVGEYYDLTTLEKIA